MENARLKTIEELNESFLKENKAGNDDPVPVIYDGEALVNSLHGVGSKPEYKAPEVFYESFFDIGSVKKDPVFYFKKIFRKVNISKNFLKKY